MVTRYPAFIKLGDPQEYLAYFEQHYCAAKIFTFDGIRVFFPKSAFDHAFYRSCMRGTDKSVFAVERAERIAWIKAALADSQAELYVGWNNEKKCFSPNRRVAIVMSDYVVIIQFQNDKKAFFITAFIADGYTLSRIRKGMKWK